MASQPSKKPTHPKAKKKRKPAKSELIKKSIERSKRSHKEYGTSNLEKKFAKEFLDKLGVEYEYQYFAKDIKRYFDFYLPVQRTLIEVDGTYYHAYGKLYEEMSPMQKHNSRVDKIKNDWAAMHGIPLIRVWEHDINNKPSMVMDMLREQIGIQMDKLKIKENKKKRH